MQPHLHAKLEYWPPFRLDVVPPADSRRREQAPWSGVSIPRAHAGVDGWLLVASFGRDQ